MMEIKQNNENQVSEAVEVNRQIVCGVKNCAYHCGDCGCKAEQIAVGPTYASSSTDTVCATFKPKEL